MGEEFYAIIKLVSGEEVFSLVCIDENDGDPVLVLQNPVMMKLIANNNGSFIKVKPWIELSTDNIYVIKIDKIITITESKNEKIIKLYEDYVISDHEDQKNNYKFSENGKVKLSNKMGYITSVDEARKNLENLFDNN